MARCRSAAALAALTAVTAAAPAFAHGGDPNYESLVTATGATKLDAQVLSGDDRLEVHNRTGQVVVIEGYDGEPYARLLPDGTVQVNTRSPATYLNDDPEGDAKVPASADPEAEPLWRTVPGNGRFQFHDHRIHWMNAGRPPKVRADPGPRQKVFDWAVPMTVGSQPASIRGTLWWRGTDEGGMPVAAIGALGAVVLLGGALVVVVRRRRGDGEEEAW